MRQRSLFKVVACASLLGCGAFSLGDGATWKVTSATVHNCTLKVASYGFGDQTQMTGTGVTSGFGCAVTAQDPSPDYFWVASVGQLKIAAPDNHNATLYPITGDTTDPPPLQVFRNVRLDSTIVAGSSSGTSYPVTVTATFDFVQFHWTFAFVGGTLVYLALPVGADAQDVTLTVTPKAFNVVCLNATTVNTTSSEQGWQYMDPLDPNLKWASVSRDMASTAASLFPNANYACLSGDLHDKADLILTSLPGDRTSKLIGQATCHFNSSHGDSGGFSDRGTQDPFSLPHLAWSEIGNTAGHHIQGYDDPRDLVNRLVFLYSCDCGWGSGPQNAFHNGGGNTAVFGFNGTVLSTLTTDDLTDPDVYSDASGQLQMLDKPSEHVSDLITRLAAGQKAADALDNHVNDHNPPRTFDHGANGVNWARILKMHVGGDGSCTLHKIYISPYDDLTNDWLLVPDWALINRHLSPFPEGLGI